MGDEHLGELWFLMDQPNNGRLFQSCDDRVGHAPDRRDALILPGKTSFTEEVVRPKNCDDCLLTLLRNDGKLHLPILDVKDRIRRVSLCEDDLFFAILANALAVSDTGEKRL